MFMHTICRRHECIIITELCQSCVKYFVSEYVCPGGSAVDYNNINMIVVQVDNTVTVLFRIYWGEGRGGGNRCVWCVDIRHDLWYYNLSTHQLINVIRMLSIEYVCATTRHLLVMKMSEQPFQNSLSHLFPQKIIYGMYDNSEQNNQIYFVLVSIQRFFFQEIVFVE